MVDILAVALVAAGAVMLFAGAVLSVYGIALLGAVVGGGGGLLIATELGFGATPELVAGVGVGALVGVLVTYLVLSFAIGMLALAVGGYVGASGAEWVLEEPGLAVVAVAALVVGAVAAFLGSIFKRTVMVFVTAIAGAALASRAVTLGDLSGGDVFFDLGEPLFLGLFVLGALTQLGLFQFGYVTKIVGLLPGARVLTDRDR